MWQWQMKAINYIFVVMFSLLSVMGQAQEHFKFRPLSPEEMNEVEELRKKRGEEYIEAQAKASSVRVKGGVQETFLGFRFGMPQSEVESHVAKLVREGKLDNNRQYTVNYDPSYQMGHNRTPRVCSAKSRLFFDYYLGHLYKMGLIVEQKASDPNLYWVTIIDEPLSKKGFDRFDYGWSPSSYSTSYLKDNMDVSYSEEKHYLKVENKKKRKSRIDQPPTIESITSTLIYTDLYVDGLIRKSKEEPIRRQLESTKLDF